MNQLSPKKNNIYLSLCNIAKVILEALYEVINT